MVITPGKCLSYLKKLFLKGQNIIDLTDEYISWLVLANAGMLNLGNLYCFDYAIRQIPGEAPMVEIGAFCGLSTNVITYYKKKYGCENKLITCDKWEFEGAEKEGTLGSSKITSADYREFVKKTFINNIMMFSKNDLPFPIEMISDDFFEAWRKGVVVEDIWGREIQLHGPISFCFIDGNHSYDFCRRDFTNCDQFLQSGGFILFDDSDGSFPGVSQVVKEVESTGNYELIIRNPNCLFKKK